jgi:exoribonuclease-2
MSEGRIIEYIDQGDFITAYCLQDEGNRLHLVTPSNREVNLSPKRALLISSSSRHFATREELLRSLKQTEDFRKRLKEKVQVKELWELVKDEQQSFDHPYLAQLCFTESISDDHVSALVRALFDDKVHFKMKDGRFIPNSEEKIAEMMRQREEEALREDILKEGGAWLKKAAETKPGQAPQCKDQVVSLLVELALHREEAPNFKFGKELLQRAGIADIAEVRKILVHLGIWEEDENLDLLRFQVRISFSEEQLAESERVSQREIGNAGREDLRGLKVFTIDGPLTRDFDDALSLEVKGDVYDLGIHIADVASLIPGESALDREAMGRGSSLYLMRRQIPMLPSSLSQEKLSLIKGCDRPAISLLSRLDKEGNLLDYRFVPSLIRVHEQLTYDYVNEGYEQNSLLSQLYEFAKRHRQKRVEGGALVLSLPEVVVEAEQDSSVSIRLVDQDSPSRMMVAELMIFYNWLAARFCKENRIPALYRCQEPPSEVLPRGEGSHAYYVFKQRRKLNPLVIDTEPRRHSGLGVDLYTNVSSPIRRYFDLVVQRQMVAHLFHRSQTYTKDALEKIRMNVEPVLKDFEIIKRNRTRYWVQKHLLAHLGERYPALVLDSLKNRYRLVLTDFLFVVELKGESGLSLSEGQMIQVRVKKSDPWNDVLRVEVD